MTAEERFWSKVDPCRTDGCALWLGAVNNDGYGGFRVNGRWALAHHFLVGAPPIGHEWDHVKERGCTHRECVWPGHLEAVTHSENVKRGSAWHHFRDVAQAITHCPKGHFYDTANTRIEPFSGARRCRQCSKARERARWAKQTRLAVPA